MENDKLTAFGLTQLEGQAEKKKICRNPKRENRGKEKREGKTRLLRWWVIHGQKAVRLLTFPWSKVGGLGIQGRNQRGTHGREMRGIEGRNPSVWRGVT